MDEYLVSFHNNKSSMFAWETCSFSRGCPSVQAFFFFLIAVFLYCSILLCLYSVLSVLSINYQKHVKFSHHAGVRFSLSFNFCIYVELKPLTAYNSISIFISHFHGKSLSLIMLRGIKVYFACCLYSHTGFLLIGFA